MRDQDAGLRFADESGQVLRPPKARTWSRRGHIPRVTVRVGGSGRISLAGLVCRHRKDGHRPQLLFRTLVHHRGKGRRRSFHERDFARLLDAAHQRLGGAVVPVRDNYTHHVDAAMRELIAARGWDCLPLPFVHARPQPGRGRVGPSEEQPELPGPFEHRRTRRTGPHAPEMNAVSARVARRIRRRDRTHLGPTMTGRVGET
ncbi:IS630 family transposase [Streptomyces sp. 769]|nr:IS630 family transposase [Streptomyces sp. 769]